MDLLKSVVKCTFVSDGDFLSAEDLMDAIKANITEIQKEVFKRFVFEKFSQSLKSFCQSENLNSSVYENRDI